MGKFIDLSGHRFGRLLVLSRATDQIDKTGKPRTMWLCQCDCGTIKSIAGNSLRTGKTTSCGCFGKEQRLQANTKHGLSHTHLKRCYYNMHSRCENPNTPKFKNHGGRGIKVCQEWSGENGFITFYNWALANGYKENLTLDREDNNGNYTPENCRWVDYETQNFNKRTNRLFLINGEIKHAKDFCKQYDININTFWQRAFKGNVGADLVRKPSHNKEIKINGI